MRHGLFTKFNFFLIIFLLVGSLLLCTFHVVQAQGPYDDGIFDEGEEIFDDLILEGGSVRVAGTVHGMLFAFGETITIQETAIIDDDAFLFGNQIIVEEGAVIKGNLVVGGQNVQVFTNVDRSLFVGAATLSLSDQVKVNQNVFFGGFHLETGEDTVVTRNLYAGSYQTILNGSVNQNVRIGAAAVRLNGAVGGDVILDVEAAGEMDNGMQYWYSYMQQFGIPDPIEPGLQLAPSAKIDGELIYTSPDKAFGLDNGLVAGGIVYQTPQPENIVEAESQQINITYHNPWLVRIFNVLRNFISLILIGALLLWLLPTVLKDTSAEAAAKPVNSAGVGLVSMIVAYIGGGMLVGLLIFLSLFFGFISLGGLGSAVFFMGITTLAWLITTFTILAVYVSKLVVADWLGNLVLSNHMENSKYKSAVGLLIGLSMIVLVSAIPFFGWLFNIAVTLVGLGAMWFYYKKRTEKINVDPSIQI